MTLIPQSRGRHRLYGTLPGRPAIVLPVQASYAVATTLPLSRLRSAWHALDVLRPPYRERISDHAENWERAARAEIERMLQPDEHLHWYGRPQQGLRFAPQDAFQIPFQPPVGGGFAIFWEAEVLLRGAPFFFAIWGIPFVGMGLYLIAGRFFVDRGRRASTYYGLTSQRALIVKAARRRSATSIDLAAQQAFDFSENRAGRGTIGLGSASGGRVVPSWSWPGLRASQPTFEAIEDACAVYDKLLEAQRAIREPAATKHRVAPLMRVDSLSGDVLEETDDGGKARKRS
jgi:hypothetical protein